MLPGLGWLTAFLLSSGVLVSPDVGTDTPFFVVERAGSTDARWQCNQLSELSLFHNAIPLKWELA